MDTAFTGRRPNRPITLAETVNPKNWAITHLLRGDPAGAWLSWFPYQRAGVDMALMHPAKLRETLLILAAAVLVYSAYFAWTVPYGHLGRFGLVTGLLALYWGFRTAALTTASLMVALQLGARP